MRRGGRGGSGEMERCVLSTRLPGGWSGVGKINGGEG